MSIARRNQARQLRAEGWKYAAIAAEMGVSESCAQYYVKTQRTAAAWKRNQPVDELRDRKVLSRWQEGASFATIGKEFGISHQRARELAVRAAGGKLPKRERPVNVAQVEKSIRYLQKHGFVVMK